MLQNVQLRLNSSKFFEDTWQSSFGKWLKIDRKTSEISTFLLISDIFSNFFEI